MIFTFLLLFRLPSLSFVVANVIFFFFLYKFGRESLWHVIRAMMPNNIVKCEKKKKKMDIYFSIESYRIVIYINVLHMR